MLAISLILCRFWKSIRTVLNLLKHRLSLSQECPLGKNRLGRVTGIPSIMIYHHLPVFIIVFIGVSSGNLPWLWKITISNGKIHYVYSHVQQLC